jgi:hypothetical protein
MAEGVAGFVREDEEKRKTGHLRIQEEKEYYVRVSCTRWPTENCRIGGLWSRKEEGEEPKDLQ